MTDLILYTTEDGRSQIKLRAQEQTVWLTQLEGAELFDATKQSISLYLKNVFEDGELDAGSAVKESLTVQMEGSREVQRPSRSTSWMPSWLSATGCARHAACSSAAVHHRASWPICECGPQGFAVSQSSRLARPRE